jgi:hypothetical protein
MASSFPHQLHTFTIFRTWDGRLYQHACIQMLFEACSWERNTDCLFLFVRRSLKSIPNRCVRCCLRHVTGDALRVFTCSPRPWLSHESLTPELLPRPPSGGTAPHRGIDQRIRDLLSLLPQLSGRRRAKSRVARLQRHISPATVGRSGGDPLRLILRQWGGRPGSLGMVVGGTASWRSQA